MVKSLLLLAFWAHIFVLTSCTGNYQGAGNNRRTGNYRRIWRSPRNQFPCSKNEIWVQCPEAVCIPKTCQDVGFPVSCCDLRQTGVCPGRPGCICKEGFVRNYRGICIPIQFCRVPICKKRNEVYDPCPSSCPARTCGINDAAITCAPALPLGHPQCPPPTCRCKNGYYRNHLGNCVLWKNCPRCRKPNEVYDPCPAPCPEQACGVDKALILCEVPPQLGSSKCKPACRCIDGFVKNESNICIPENECPPPCGGDPNAVTGCGVYCNQRCRDIGKEDGACNLICYPDSCDCRRGYYLDDNTKKCVLPQQCTPQCPFNEAYSDCIQSNCNPQNCSQLGFPIPCPRIDPNFCKKGCLCKEGYVRNYKGVCIPKSDCPSCAGDCNKVSGCGVYCNQRCRDIGSEPGACIEVCYENACNCRDGYFLDEHTGFCVLPKECTPQCPENEWYSECTQGNCSPENCTQVGFPLSCPRIDPKYCKKGCLCEEGYARNEEGFCIPSNECPSCGGDPNAQAGCGGNCNKHCSDIGKKPGACILICELNGCNCKDGFYYDDETFKCVKPEKCPVSIPSCGINEEYTNCTNAHCGAQTCDDLGFPVTCDNIEPEYCTPGCRCKPGYVRNNKEICIPSHECPSCGGDPNAQPGCGGNCNKHCYNVGQKPGVCALSCILNGCNCKDGYYFDDNIKKCVRPKDCTPTCPRNEIYSNCINGGCQARNCSQYDEPVPCIKMDPKYCKKGCVCKDTFLRARNGKCVPEEKCPEACNGPKDEYSECSWNCPPRTCESLDRAYICPIREEEDCEPLCRCKPGYFENKIGQCITEEECKMCRGPHEYYSCGGACDNVCSTLSEQSQDNCPIINIKCNEMCYCERGYARAKNNTCIPISSCDADTYQCPKNERYENCPGSNCEPQHCAELGFSRSCSTEDEATCSTKPGCVCINGYVRNSNGKCIAKNQCPSCRGDSNARSGCGVNCGKRCRDLIKPSPCLRICYVDACDCIDGFYYDSNQDKCVLAGQCTDICGKNEVFEDCSNPICRAKNCTDVGFPLDCDKPCEKGCVCQNGYVRDINGICIPIKQCPSCGGDSNAQPGCGTNCGRRCPNNYINPKFCPKIACVPQLNKCDCKDGFYFDINTQSCVERDDCSPRCNDSNKEEYDPCTNGGCGWRNCSEVGGPMLCIDPIKCNKGCKCKDGYYRLDNGTCVLEEMCPYWKCNGPNEYFSCGSACDNVCAKLDTESKYNCPIVNIQCVSQCYCEDGFARDENGICIPINQCPPCDAGSSEEK